MKISNLIIVLLSTFVQCYDYALFGLSSAILAKSFMPEDTEAEQLLGFFTIFSLAVVARPIGSIIFGMIGDSAGRVNSVKIATIIAVISTSLIGLTPSFQNIGYAATVILILCRMMFLMSLAGEIDATRIYIAERTGKKYRNFANSLVSFYSQIGALCAAFAYHLAISSEIANLWRLNFIIGGIVGIIIILMRKSFQESEVFLKFQASNNNKKAARNIFILIKEQKLKFIISMLISGCSGGVYHFLVIFFGVFIAKIALLVEQKDGQILNIYLIIIYAVFSLFSGFIADKFNPKRQIIVAMILSLFTVIFILLSPKNPNLLMYMIPLLVTMLPCYSVPLQIMIQSIFDIGIRMRMCSLSHSIGSMIFSSTTPFFSMLIWKQTNSVTAVFYFLLSLITIIFISVNYLFRILKS